MHTPHTIEACLTELQVSYTTNARVRTPLLDGVAEIEITPAGEQVPDLLACLAQEGLPYHVVGGGSNTLMTGTPGAPARTPVISTKKIRGISQNGERITVGAGTPIAAVAKFAGRRALSGLEFARDIPGTTAGAIATDAWHPIHSYAQGFEDAGLNHTSFNKYISALLLHADIVSSDGAMVAMTSEDLEMANRSSRLLRPSCDLFLVRATLGLERGEQSTIDTAMGVIHRGRKEMRDRNRARNVHAVGKTLGFSFVLDHESYGGKSAAQIIAETDALPEVLDSQGMQHSKQTPNIIGNTGNGTAEGYLRIVEQIQETVASEHGIALPLEVTILK